MLILLVRAGQTVDLAPEAHRHLSTVGRQVTRAVSRRVKRELDELGVTVDAVLVAPVVAAVQTAELFAEGVDHIGVVESLHLLLQGVPPRLAAEKIITRTDGLVVLVGDEPALADLGAFLVGKPTFPPHLPSQVSLIDDRRGVWTLRPDTMDRVPLVLS